MATKKATKKAAKAVQVKKVAKKTAPRKRDGKLSVLDAAAKILGETETPMTTGAMIEAMGARGYWTSPGGQTPAATLYAAITHEIGKKGAEARFQKVDRGQFTLRGVKTTPKPAKSTKAKLRKADAQDKGAVAEVTEPTE